MQAFGEKTHRSGGEETFWNYLKHAYSVLSQTSKQYFK